jgi:glycosyltransferase involved in cell wall biosynthesis
MKDAIWITWENQVRNRSLAGELGVKLFVHLYVGNRYLRYISCIGRTFSTLLRERPKIVFVQNPSLVLNYILLLSRPFFGFKLVSDAHFAGILSFNRHKIIQKALDLCNCLMDLVIVTNSEHANYLKTIGGNAVISEDPLPDIERYSCDQMHDRSILFICSFDVDEPYRAAFRAAELLTKEGFTFMVTGNYKKAGINKEEYPSVQFLGYVSEPEYYRRLFQCDIVLDLTESDNCLVCGAYEAMAADKPLVTSDTECLRNYFEKGTVFTRNDEHSIAEAIKYAFSVQETLRAEIRVWKQAAYALRKERNADIYRALGLATSEQ